MEITSFSFFLLVGISLVVYWHLPHRFQWGVLLFDSVLFYFANASWGTFVYICVSVASIYSAVHFFQKKPEASAESKRKCVLILAIVLNAGILVILKYMNFVIHTWNFFGERILHVKGLSDVAWLAPMAVSFYTLQLLNYLLGHYYVRHSYRAKHHSCVGAIVTKDVSPYALVGDVLVKIIKYIFCLK